MDILLIGRGIPCDWPVPEDGGSGVVAAGGEGDALGGAETLGVGVGVAGGVFVAVGGVGVALGVTVTVAVGD